MRLVARSHLRQPMVAGVSKPLGQSRPFPRLFSFLSANADNSSAGSHFLRMFSPFFQTVFSLPDDKLLLQILAFALIRGICRMSPVPTCSAALQRCQRCFSRMLWAHRPGSQAGGSQADRHLLSVFQQSFPVSLSPIIARSPYGCPHHSTFWPTATRGSPGVRLHRAWCVSLAS